MSDNEKNTEVENESTVEPMTDSAVSETAEPACAKAEGANTEEAACVAGVSDGESDSAEAVPLPAEPAAEGGECLPAVEEKEPEAVYAFRWRYYDQCLHDANEAEGIRQDKKTENKKRKSTDRAVSKNIGVYFVVMLLAFSFAFAVLAFSLSFDDMAGWFADDPNEAMTVMQIVDKGMPSTVAVYARKEAATYSIGSGFVISDYGYVVTNYHVVENSTAISIVDSKQNEYAATMVGYDAADDIAVLYIENCPLKAVMLGDSSALELGETLVAIGTPAGTECEFSVSDGIVSGLNRRISGKRYGMIQTNAPLNPGNSGGPLFDSRGNLVGIVTIKYSYSNKQENGQYIPYEGMSFAIPINAVMEKISEYIDNDLLTPKVGISAVPVKEGNAYFYYAEQGTIYPYIRTENGEYYVDKNNKNQSITNEMRNNKDNLIVTIEKTGVMVVGVTPGLGGDGKLEKGDVIVSGNGIGVTTVQDFINICKGLGLGDKVKVEFYRNGIKMETEIVLKSKKEMLNAIA